MCFLFGQCGQLLKNRLGARHTGDAFKTMKRCGAALAVQLFTIMCEHVFNHIHVGSWDSSHSYGSAFWVQIFEMDTETMAYS